MSNEEYGKDLKDIFGLNDPMHISLDGKPYTALEGVRAAYLQNKQYSDEEQNRLARERNDRENAKKENWPLGYFVDSNGNIIHTNDPIMSFGDNIMSLIEMLFMLDGDAIGENPLDKLLADPSISGDPSLQMAAERVKNSAIGQVIADKNHPDRGMTSGDLLEKHGKELLDLKPGINTLLQYIAKAESGNRPNVLNDYRSRMPALEGNTFNGLNPGETTLGGLIVPDVLTTNAIDVYNWQIKYLEEQKNYSDADFPLGIPIPQSMINGMEKGSAKRIEEQERLDAVSERIKEDIKAEKNRYRSTAIGGLQVVSGTLLKAIKDNVIDGDKPLDQTAQLKIKLHLIMEKRGMKDFLEGKIEAKDVIRELGNEWEALKTEGAQKFLQEHLTGMITSGEAQAYSPNAKA